ncbi:MAG TPA: vWA domain-containing protein [Thermoplasmata archaeon]|nr:vWA domain-containing protein [Thermoplasmata archaeon]
MLADESTNAPAALPVKERHVLVLDLSKSMLAPLPDPDVEGPEKQKIEVARTAVYRIVENAANAGASFGLVTFTETVRIAVPLTEIRPESLPHVESLIAMLTPSGRSAIWDAVAVGADLLRTGSHGVRGNLVLVTDGWDNASNRFEVKGGTAAPANGAKADLVPHLLPSDSELTFRIIGIGSGAERDRGVDSAAMNRFLGQLTAQAASLTVPANFSYQEVVTGSQLFSQMVHAFLDVDLEGVRPLDQLHPEELARHAAGAARALKEPQQHVAVTRLSDHLSAPMASTASEPSNGTAMMEVDVLSAPGGVAPAYLRERYGPLGSVIESYLNQDYAGALERLGRTRTLLPAVTRSYWEARIRFAQGDVVEAARHLIEAWAEAEKLPPDNRIRVVRRLALLQARMQNDKETETLVQFIDDTDQKLARADPKMKARLHDLFGKLMELRSTYRLTRLEGDGATAAAALQHEQAVEAIFGLLQDTRLENTGGEPAVEGALDFIEICLAEMR